MKSYITASLKLTVEIIPLFAELTTSATFGHYSKQRMDKIGRSYYLIYLRWADLKQATVRK